MRKRRWRRGGRKEEVEKVEKRRWRRGGGKEEIEKRW